MTESDEVLKAKINSETAKIAWQELQRHFARGIVIKVGNDADLIEVAVQFSKDDKKTVTEWLERGKVSKATDEDAIAWQANNSVFWAAVVAPWVLVQEIGVGD